MPFTLSPEQLRRSAHARQLAAGVSTLRFEPRLEAAFRAAYSDSNFHRQRVMLLLGTALIALFAAVDAFRLSGPPLDWALGLRLGLLLPALAAAIVLAWSRLGPRLIEPAIMALLVLVGLALVSIYHVAAAHGQAYPSEGLYMLSVVTFFLTGLTFWRAVGCSTVVLAAFVLGRLVVDLTGGPLAFHAFALLMIDGLCAVGCHLLEQRARVSFLTSAILTEAADHDGLTGIANRRAFDHRFDELVGLSLTRARPLALLLLDLDRFKDYNDRYGHLEGDRCLRQVAQVLEDFARRPQDLVARFGGEEFAVLLFEVSIEAAVHQAEALRIAIRDLGIPHTPNKPARVMTASIGVAALEPGRGGSTVSLLAAADQALYAAKHNGRDRVERSEPEPALEH